MPIENLAEDYKGAFCWPCTCCNRCGRMTNKYRCPMCQTEIEPGSTMCPKCGAPVVPPPGASGSGTLASPSAPPAPSSLGH